MTHTVTPIELARRAEKPSKSELGRSRGTGLGQSVPLALLSQKITIPDRVTGYVHRAELLNLALPTRRRLTLLKATGGFGKTTLMAECCRRTRQDGIATAWLSLDEYDSPGVLDAYIAFACTGAGLDLHDALETKKTVGGPEPRIGTVVGAIESLGASFVIAFDELERLSAPGSISLLAFLLERGPPNLHLLFACREIPDGIDIAGVLLDGRAEVIETEDLRFSRPDVGRFFGLSLSRRALAEVANDSAGWPFALSISRNERQRGSARHLTKNWIESRLFTDLGRDERDLVLDLGLFDWFDAGLLNEVLQQTDSMRGVEVMGVLEGLIERVRSGGSEIRRLHALIRNHCAAQRFREDPDRFLEVHRRIAGALASRGQTLQAMRHAIDGNDPFLAGEILQRAGGVRLFTRLGVTQYLEADRLLSEDVVIRMPRLRLVRCVALSLTGRRREAKALFAECRKWTPADGSDVGFELDADISFAHGCIGLYGGEAVGSGWSKAVVRDARFAASPGLDARTRGHFEYALAVRYFLKGEFDNALAHLSAARELLSGTHYIECYGELLRGQIDFVRGRVQDAESRFLTARRMARRYFVLDPVAATAGDVPLYELVLERDVPSNSAEPAGVRRAVTSAAVPYSYFSTAANVLIDTRISNGRVEEALAVADELLSYVRSAELTGFVRLVVALRISVLVTAGRVRDADRAWRFEKLPDVAEACVGLESQSWREMEAVSEARGRLLMATRRYDEARHLLRELHAFAAKRSFRRIQMRALALSSVLERRAGNAEASARHLTEYLGLFADSPYAWPLVREREVFGEPLNRYLASNADSTYKNSARRLLAVMSRLGSGPHSVLTKRERDVLRRLPGQSVKQVAASLGLSVHGVRYHLRKLFAKLQVSNRADLLRRAREMDLIPDDC
ncbi:MAG: LuxR C-terminal-related transcriptional regulator [Gammaproteobacteria bacterium]|nr:LuxR C-terminal-related transcriptional regulator [Gammaproteobacteria bacterium]